MIRELKRQIKVELEDVGYPAAFGTMPQREIYPHIVLDLPSDIYQEGLHNLTLDINVWDKSESSANVDAISEMIIDRLDRIRIMSDHHHAIFYFLSMGSFDSEDPTLRRKTLIFNVQLRRK